MRNNSMTHITIIEYFPSGVAAARYIIESPNHRMSMDLDRKQAQSVADRLYNSGLHIYGGTYIKSGMIIREWRM